MAFELSLYKVVLEGDSKAVVDGLTKKYVEPYLNLKLLLDDMLDVCTDFNLCSFSWVPKVENGAAGSSPASDSP